MFGKCGLYCKKFGGCCNWIVLFFFCNAKLSPKKYEGTTAFDGYNGGLTSTSGIEI